MSNQTSRIQNVDVGTPPSSLNEWEIINVRYHDFENLTTTRGDAVLSPGFTCFGHQWCVRIYPGGKTNSDDGKVGIFLHNRSNKSITLQFGFSVKNKDHKSRIDWLSPPDEGNVFPGAKGLGHGNICERSTIIDTLVDGTLIIEVRMRQTIGSTDMCSPFTPDNPFVKTIFGMFNDEESADVIFEVENEKVETAEHKRAKTTTAFHAHRNILQKSCYSTLLGELCKSGGEESVGTVSITDVTPEIFRHMLYYVYGGKISENDMNSNAKEIIDAADKYGIVTLKLEAEAAFVTSTTITFDNVIDNLLYADATNCALIKEAVMDFIYENRKEAVTKLSFNDVPGHVITDLLTAVNREEFKGSTSPYVNSFNLMRVGTLRKMLDEKGLDIDGSREMMIARLRESP